MNSRIDALVDLFNLREHFATRKSDLEKISMNFDRIKTKQILDIKRTESIDFLKNALSK